MAQTARKSEKPTNIRKYRKPLNLNIGMIIFGVVFIYVIVCVILYFQTTHITSYEVREGSLSTNNMYKGIIIREETVVTAGTAGYVNYYAREGERVASGDLVYTIDETGRLQEYLDSINLGENSLSDRELAEFRNDIVNFMHGFDPKNYDSVYDFKYTLKGTVLKLANTNIMDNINDINSSSELTALVDFCNAPETGIVAYWTDGYEDLTARMVTENILSEKEYSKNQLAGNELAAVDDTVYKLSTSENWSIVVLIDEERAEEFEAENYIKVRFMKNQYESWGKVYILRNEDGNTYLQLSFTNSMITFVSDRFMDIELLLNDEKGLKIPNSSIVQKEFFLIPTEYIFQGGSNGNTGVLRQSYLEDGTISSEFIETDVYYKDEEANEYYLDTVILGTGDILYKQDSQDTYTVSRRATLIGVYNINKGYADFRQINILNQNDEYAIVESNTKYGLNVYDYIVLDVTAVSDDQFIFE